MSRFQKDSGTIKSSKLSLKLVLVNFLILRNFFLGKLSVRKLLTLNLPRKKFLRTEKLTETALLLLQTSCRSESSNYYPVLLISEDTDILDYRCS